MTMADDINSAEYIKNKAAAFFIISSFTVRLNKEVTSLSLNMDKADETSTMIVVIFIPPAVDPGAPPISIRMIMIILPLSLKLTRLWVLNPAVLVVMDWKKEENNRSRIGNAWNSTVKKKTAGTRISRIVIKRTERL